MFSRTWRNLRNEQLNTELAADVTYNKPAIDKLVKRVRKSLDRNAKDANARPQQGPGRARPSPRPGLRVKYNSLAKDVEKTLLTPNSTEP